MPGIAAEPSRSSYDVVIVGGAMIGSAIAWFLSREPGFDGTVLVVERDPSYSTASTTLTNSCMRQQFSNELNVRISQFAADFVRSFRDHLGGDPTIPDIDVDHFGYMYLAGDERAANALRESQAVQASLGAGTEILDPAEIASRYPFYNVADIVCGSHNRVDEGYFDGGTMFEWLRRAARSNGVEYLVGEVVGLGRTTGRVDDVVLASGTRIRCGTMVNAAGPRAPRIASMAGLDLPVEPRKRYTFVFLAAEPLGQPLPLTIDPSGVHVRTDGQAYMAGCGPPIDDPVDVDDFAMDHEIFEDRVWPVLVHRIPAFEQLKVVRSWAGHYSYNTLDQNVVVGPHDEVTNFVFANGFSGHGLQQAPAIGRGVAELVTYGSYRTLDLTPLGYDRIVRGEPFVERAII